jgi:hypothetical protein
LFSWDKIPGNDCGRLIEFLKRKYDVEWVKTAKIEKIKGDKIIIANIDRKSLLLSLNNEKNKVNLTIDDGRTYEFIARTENGKLNIYS